MKKLLSLSLALLLALGTLSVAFADGGLSGKNEFPFVTEPRKIVIATPITAGVIDFNTNDQTLELEATTGLDIEWVMLPQTDYIDKVNLLFSSGTDMPDAFFACDQVFTPAMLSTLGSQGLIEPLNDYIDKWGYNINAAFDAYPQMKPLVTSADGNIYSLPRYTPNMASFYAQRFWINKRFMEALGIEKLPETTEEFYDYLVAVKNGDPNGNGIADEIPLAAAGGDIGWMQQIDGFLMQPFVYTDAASGTTNVAQKRRIYMTEEGLIEYAPVQEGWREALKYLNRLYNEGMFSSDVFTMINDQLKALVENEVEMVGAVPSGGPHMFANINGERRKDYVILPPLTGPDGTRQSFYNPYEGLLPGYFVVPTASKEKDLAVKLADYLMSMEQFIRGRYGVEGRDWQTPEPGTKAWDGSEARVEVIGNLSWGSDQNVYLMCRYPYVGFASHATVDNGDPLHLERILWDAKEAYDDYGNSRHVPPLTLTEEEAREYNDIVNTLHQYVELSIAEFVTGVRSLDTDWDAYVQECEKIGCKRLIEIDQTVFDRQWKDSWSWQG